MTSRIRAWNQDNSWLWEIGKDVLLLDPWLEGKQKNGPSWFSEEWLTDYGPGYEAIPKGTKVFVAFPFTDHYHKATLAQLKAMGLEISLGYKQKSAELGNFSARKYGKHHLQCGWEFCHHSTGQRIFYSPHGWKWTPGQLAPKTSPLLWITSVRSYRLPWWLGGSVALGWEEQEAGHRLLNPSHVLRSHDGEKPGKGLLRNLSWRGQMPEKKQWLELASGEGLDLV